MTNLIASSRISSFLLTTLAATAIGAGAALAHGDVAPQPMNTESLPEIGEEWLIENPYRGMDADVYEEAIRIGASGYNQNCARCHGLEVISGGLAPDLRFLEAEEYGDEWYMERFQFGYTQNGTTKMPAFDEVLGQKAGWAIRTYIETRPDDEQIGEFSDQLRGIRDALLALEDPAQAATFKDELTLIAGQIETLSGAELADSIAYRANKVLDAATPATYAAAAEVLTIGLSVAH